MEWVEGLTKVRQGGLSMKERSPSKDVCPVCLTEKLVSRRPSTMKMSGLLYLTPLQHFKDRNIWYSQVPFGINKKLMASLENTNEKFTNRSAHRTTVCKLQKSDVSNDKTMSLTDHRSEQSLRDYAYGH